MQRVHDAETCALYHKHAVIIIRITPKGTLMRLNFSLFFATVILAACQPTMQTVYWRDGANVVQRQNDYTDCEIEAVNKVPTAMRVASTPTYTTPAYVSPTNTSCYGYRYSVTCTTTSGTITGGQTYGGQVYSYDANEGLRSRVHGQCMARKGYSLITLPTCTKEQEKLGVVKAGTQVLPSASQLLCGTSTGYVLKSQN
jgi:hypothetical protein